MDMNFIHVFTPILFVIFLVISLIVGWFGGWKRSLYYSGFNLALLTIFAIITWTKPELFVQAGQGISFWFSESYQKWIQAGLVIASPYIAMVLYLISFGVLNIILVIIHLIFLRKLLHKFARQKDSKTQKTLKIKNKRFKKGLLGSLTQLTLWLPISFVFSGVFSTASTIASNVQAVQNKSSLINNENVDKFLDQASQQLKQFYAPWSQIKILGDVESSNQKMANIFLSYKNQAQISAGFENTFKNVSELFKTDPKDLSKTDIQNLINSIQNSLKNGSSNASAASGSTSSTTTSSTSTNNYLIDNLTQPLMDEITANNPNLKKVTEAINKIYYVADPTYFSWISNIFNDLSLDDLNKMNPLFDVINFEGKIIDFWEPYAKINSGKALEFVATQLNALVSYDKSDVKFSQNQRIRVSTNFENYLLKKITDALEKTYAPYRTEATTKQADAVNGTQIKNFAKAILNVISYS